MGRALLPSPTARFNRDAYELFDDFVEYVSTDLWTDIQTDATSTCALADGQYSNLKILTSADNESVVVHTTYEMHKFITLKPIYTETLITFTDGATATSNAALAFGFADAFALDIIADGGQSLAINDSGAMIFKLSEGTAWKFQTEIGGTAVTSTSTAVPQSSSAQLLAIDIIPISATVFQARPFLDGVQLLDSTSGDPIQHDITLGTATDMQLGFELKGGHANDTSCLIDYVYASQAR